MRLSYISTSIIAASVAGVVIAGCGGTGVGASSNSMVTTLKCATPLPSPAKLAALETHSAMGHSNALPPAGPITVYFHVINSGISVEQGDVPQQWIDDQIDVLNAAYASHGYSFSLASVDRTTDAAAFNMAQGSAEETNTKNLLRQGTGTTLNIYSANLGGTQRGWATFPWDLNPANKLDGVVIYFQTMPGGSAPGFGLGNTTVHEVGHWLGLYHTYENGCHKQQGDKVSDTAPEDSAASGCPVGRDSCKRGDLDPISNFMDGTDDSCTNNFTAGQASRMDDMWTTYRLGN